jgi:hypothetical protein
MGSGVNTSGQVTGPFGNSLVATFVSDPAISTDLIYRGQLQGLSEVQRPFSVGENGLIVTPLKDSSTALSK